MCAGFAAFAKPIGSPHVRSSSRRLTLQHALRTRANRLAIALPPADIMCVKYRYSRPHSTHTETPGGTELRPFARRRAFLRTQRTGWPEGRHCRRYWKILFRIWRLAYPSALHIGNTSTRGHYRLDHGILCTDQKCGWINERFGRAETFRIKIQVIGRNGLMTRKYFYFTLCVKWGFTHRVE